MVRRELQFLLALTKKDKEFRVMVFNAMFNNIYVSVYRRGWFYWWNNQCTGR